jgi:hypothetical protein
LIFLARVRIRVEFVLSSHSYVCARVRLHQVKQYTLQFDPNDTCSDAIINLIQNLPKIKAGTFGKQKDNRQIKFATAASPKVRSSVPHHCARRPGIATDAHAHAFVQKSDQTSTSDLENVSAESYEDYGLYLPSTSSVVTTLQSSKSTIISPFAPKQASAATTTVGPAGACAPDRSLCAGFSVLVTLTSTHAHHRRVA